MQIKNNNQLLKRILLSILVIVAGLWFWINLASVFGQEAISGKQLIWAGISLFILTILLALFSLTISKKSQWLATFAIFSLLFLLFFEFNFYYLIGLLVLFSGLYLGALRIKQEKEARLKISLKRLLPRGIPLILTCFALLIALVYYFNPLLGVAEGEIKVSPKIIGAVIKPLSGMFSQIIPFYQADMTIDEMIATSGMIGGEEGGLDIGSLPPELLKEVQKIDFQGKDISQILKENPELMEMVRQQAAGQLKKISPRILAQQRQEFAKKLGISAELRGDENLSEVLSLLINSKIGQFIGPYQKYISIGIAVAFFLFLRILAVPFCWLVIWFTWLMFEIMVVLGFIKISKVQKETEVIEI